MQIISRNMARKLDLKRFYTGEPCGRGHTSERWVAGGACIACKQENWGRWAARNPEDYARQRREGYQRNREAIRLAGQKYRAANPEKVKAWRAKAKELRHAKREAAWLERDLRRASAGLPSIRTRAEALALGERYFYTGKPCIRGHIEVPRATNTRACVECNREKSRENYAKDPEKTKAWQRANKEKCAGYVRKYTDRKKAEALTANNRVTTP